MKKIIALATTVIMSLSMVACSGVNEEDTVMNVNGTDITVGEFEKVMAINKNYMESMGFDKTIWEQESEEGKTYLDGLKEMTEEQLINIQVVYDQAKKDNILPTAEEVDKSFQEQKQSITDNKEYEAQLKELGIDEEFLKKQEEQNLAWQNYQENFEKNISITDEEISSYYEENKKDYYKDQVRASHILVSTVDENNEALPEEEVKKAKEKAEGLLKKVNAGEEFSALAKENSDDLYSAEKGGDLDFFNKGDMVAPFEEAAFSMEVGEVSEIVESQFGYHIIKVTDKVQEQMTLEDVKDQIKQLILDTKYQDSIAKLVEAAKVEKNEDIISKIKLK